MALSADSKKRLRSIGHKLNPIVTVASKGITEGVTSEIERALSDHELIKIKVQVGDRDSKKEVISTLCEQLSCELVQAIGNTALILRKNPQPNPQLSNLHRYKEFM